MIFIFANKHILTLNSLDKIHKHSIHENKHVCMYQRYLFDIAPISDAWQATLAIHDHIHTIIHVYDNTDIQIER
jgi:hypothetical protein